jgi:hypothetical protein
MFAIGALCFAAFVATLRPNDEPAHELYIGKFGHAGMRLRMALEPFHRTAQLAIDIGPSKRCLDRSNC